MSACFDEIAFLDDVRLLDDPALFELGHLRWSPRHHAGLASLTGIERVARAVLSAASESQLLLPVCAKDSARFQRATFFLSSNTVKVSSALYPQVQIRAPSAL